jgi:pimeloyl-ACP methyl ester carboxylesterase
MKIAPYRIKRIVLDTARIHVKRMPVDCFAGKASGRSSRQVVQTSVLGYSVTSSAPYNTDDKEDVNAAVDNSIEQAEAGVRAIAQDLHRIKTDPSIAEPPQLVIAVHGYNTSERGIQKWYHDIFRYVAHDDKQISQHRNLVFIGYRWSSEQILFKPKHLWLNLEALPSVPRAVLSVGLVLVLLYFGGMISEVLRSLEIIPPPALSVRLLDYVLGDLNTIGKLIELFVIVGLRLMMGGALAITIAVAVLLVLRVSVYFRDVYRAINFAVPDLTELIRQIDHAVIDLEVDSIHQSQATPVDALRQATKQHQESHERINLSFLGHSMGGLVITNTIRILSDVFDRGSIERNPTADIGHTLRLGRLILASPDIPVLSVVSSRANGLASSLRRFDEAYLFSNEGDLALRLASTAANYISFPSRHHYHGHRLGSIAIRNDLYKKGIINLAVLRAHYPAETTLFEGIKDDPYDILKCLFITRTSSAVDGYQCLGDLFEDEHNLASPVSLADLFTFFDCTDYKDYALKLRESAMNEHSKEEKGLLSRAKGKAYLDLRDYAELLWDMMRGNRDVHGGYFHGEYSRELIYRIAFLGFEGTLRAIAAEDTRSEDIRREDIGSVAEAQRSLNAFHQRCQDKGLQVYLSPLRYRVDVQGAKLSSAREEMLQIVKASERQRPASARAQESSESGAQTELSDAVEAA